MAEKKPTKKLVKKKKIWFTIIAPKSFREVVLGETPAFDGQDIIGKIVKVNLMNIVRDPKKQNTNILFKITNVEGTQARTTIYGYEIIPSSIKRLVKRRRGKIDDSFVCETKDKMLIGIKPMVITNGRTQNTVLTNIRKKIRHVASKYLLTLTYEQFINELISGRFQGKLKEEIKKVYPARIIEIKKVKIQTKKVVPIKPEDYPLTGRLISTEKTVEKEPAEEPEKSAEA